MPLRQIFAVSTCLATICTALVLFSYLSQKIVQEEHIA
jgi:hypothetical protein